MPEISFATERPNYVLLDVSMFILELLDDQKIIDSPWLTSPRLEVPAALVEMMRLHREGNPLLQIFIRAYLLGIRENEKHRLSTDGRIRSIVNATLEELNWKTHTIADKLLKTFGSVIEGLDKESLDKPAGETDKGFSSPKKYPIKSFELIPDEVENELVWLKGLYTARLRLSEHPLITLYFLQVYNAQLIQNQQFRRELIAIGRQTHEILEGFHEKRRQAHSTGSTQPRNFNSYDLSIASSGTQFGPNFQRSAFERYRNFITWFWNSYVRDEWQNAVKDVLVEVTVSAVAGASIEVPLLLATLLTIEVGKAVYRYPNFTQNERPVIFGVLTIFIFLCCIGSYRFLPGIVSALRVSTSQATPTLSILIEQVQSQPVDTITTATPMIVLVETATSALAPTAQSVANSTSDIGYCYYVIQQSDTRQSVASRFQVSEEDLKASDDLVRWGAFTLHQMIRVNAPCCRPVAGGGRTYTVQKGDTLFSLENRFGVAVDKLVQANNLYDSRYIQAGQMLCIPEP